MLPVESKSSGEAADATTDDDDAMDLLLHVSSLLLLVLRLLHLTLNLEWSLINERGRAKLIRVGVC
jgi:hypothetical protein